MKDAYIIFRNQYPQTRREVLALIKEFCQKHDLHYSEPANTDSLTVNIEGEIYTVDVHEEKDVYKRQGYFRAAWTAVNK